MWIGFDERVFTWRRPGKLGHVDQRERERGTVGPEGLRKEEGMRRFVASRMCV